MRTSSRIAAVVNVLLVFPATLFMVALFLREVQPLAQTARLVEWFSHHLVLGLYLFLIAMPLAAFVIGCTMVLRGWRCDEEFRRAIGEAFAMVNANLAYLLIGGATLVAGAILVLVALHLITG
jgi:hypothetical protein